MGISEEVFLSVPCVVGQNGVLCKVTQTLNEEEGQKLVTSSQKLGEIQKNIKF